MCFGIHPGNSPSPQLQWNPFGKPRHQSLTLFLSVTTWQPVVVVTVKSCLFQCRKASYIFVLNFLQITSIDRKFKFCLTDFRLSSCVLHDVTTVLSLLHLGLIETFFPPCTETIDGLVTIAWRSGGVQEHFICWALWWTRHEERLKWNGLEGSPPGRYSNGPTSSSSLVLQ